MASSGEDPREVVGEGKQKKSGRLLNRLSFKRTRDKNKDGNGDQPSTEGSVKKGRSSKKTAKHSSSSSRGSKTAIDTPTSDYNRDSLVLEPSPPSLPPSGAEGGCQSAGERVITESTLWTTAGQLFHDDPQRVKVEPPPTTDGDGDDVVKSKPHTQQDSLHLQLQLIEEELQARESDLGLDASNQSVPSRLTHLLTTYTDRHRKGIESVENDMQLKSKSHEVVRLKLQEEHKREVESRRQLEQELAATRAERGDLEEKLEGERERVMGEHRRELEELARKIDSERERQREEQKSVHEGELGRLDREMDRLRTQLGEGEENLLHITRDRDRHLGQCELLERRLKEVEKEKEREMKEEGYLEREKPASAPGRENDTLGDQLAELHRKCEEQQAKIAELENTVAESERKRHGQQRIAKSYEEKMKKLEHRLEEETKSKSALEAQLQVAVDDQREQDRNHDLETQLQKKGEEMEKLAKELQSAQEQLLAVQEQLCEQERKREESQQKLELLQKSTKAAVHPAKSPEYLEEYFDSVTKVCEELTDWKMKCGDREREIEKLNRVVKNAERMEAEYVEVTKRLSEVTVKAVQPQVPPTSDGRVEPGSERVRARASTGDDGDSQGNQSVRRLKREVRELKEKLASRDEELRRSREGKTRFVEDPLSPTDSMAAADTSVVVGLKLKLQERERELQNLQKQVSSMELVLQESKELKRTASRYRSENEKLTRERDTIKGHIMTQSHHVMTLKKQLEASQTKPAPESAGGPESSEAEEWKTRTETAQKELENLKATVEDLTRRLDDSREECERKVLAFEVANDQAQRCQRKLEGEVKKLKEKAEQTKSQFSVTLEENNNLKQMVVNLNAEKVRAVAVKQEASATAAVQFKESLEKMKSELYQKDLALQTYSRDSSSLRELQGKLAGAEESMRELQELNEELIRVQQQAVEEGVQRKEEEIERLREEVKVKMAQITQYKKQLQEKQPVKPTERVETLEIELATSRSTQEEAEKQLKQLAVKHAEMERHFEKKLREMDQQLQHLRGSNQRLEEEMRESATRQRLVEKEKELQLSQAQQQLAEMASELNRLQRDRKREDEFSKAFREEFEAHKAMKVKCEELQNQLDTALDSLDGMRQKQEVLMETLMKHRVEPPFVEAQAMQLTSETHQEQWGTLPSVAISQKPIASPGVFNQHVDHAGYMPPHSNAESQYLEQQAERRVNNWQQMYQGIDRAGSVARPRGAVSAAPNTHQVGEFECDAVVGIPASAVSRHVALRSQQPGAFTSQWPLQSRHSDSEIHSRQAVPRHPPLQYPVSPHRVGRVHNTQPPPISPNLQPVMCGAQGHSQLGPPQSAVPPAQLHTPVHVSHAQQDLSTVGHRAGQPNVQQDMGQRTNIPPTGHPRQQNPHYAPYPQHHPQQQQQQQQQQQTVLRPQEPSTVNPAELYQPRGPPHQQQHALPPTSHTPLLPPPDQPYQGGHTPQFPPQAEFVKAVPETASVVPTETCHGVSQPPNLAARPCKPSEQGPTGTPAPSGTPSRKDSANKQELMRNLMGTIKDTFEEVNEDEEVGSINSSLQSIPPDPNLECVLCGKVFKIGQIQNFKRHSETCPQ